MTALKLLEIVQRSIIAEPLMPLPQAFKGKSEQLESHLACRSMVVVLQAEAAALALDAGKSKLSQVHACNQ